jgi:hypothetical protein
VAAIWTIVLGSLAVIAGWAQATYLRRVNPRRRVSLIRWRLTPRGGPGWAIGVGAVASMSALLILLRFASNDLAFATAVVVGWIVVSLLVQAVVLRRHNDQFRQRL